MSFGGKDQFDTLDREAKYAELTVGTTPVELKVGGSRLEFRGLVTMHAKDNAVYWGYDASVTTTTGTRLYKGQTVFLPLGDVALYLVADGVDKKVNIGELA